MLHKMRIAKHPFLASCIVAIWFWAPIWELRGVPLWTSGSAVGGVAAASDPITFVAVAANNFSATRSPSVISPTCSTNDILLAVICAAGSASFNGSPPTGWTLLHSQADNSTEQTSAVFWARVDGVNVQSGSTQSWTNITAITESGISAVIAFSGCKLTGSPINVAGTPIAGGVATTSDGPSITPTVNNCKIVSIRTIDPGASTRTFTWDSPLTMRLGYATTPSGVNGTTAGIYIASYLQGTAALISPAGDFDASETASRFTYALEPQ
jgi:hypothetical protein